MSTQRRWALIALVTAAMVVVGVLIWWSPAFRHYMARELWAIGLVTGWIAHGAWQKHRKR